MKFLIVGDLHGNMPIIHFKDFDAIIAPGDICPDKYMRPYYDKWFKYIKEHKDVSSVSKFFYKTTGLTKEKSKIITKKSLHVGRKILKFLDSFGKPVFFIPGNWDFFQDTFIYGDGPVVKYKGAYMEYSMGTERSLIKGFKNIVDCQLKLHKFENFNIFGYGYSSFPEKPPIKYKKKSKSKYLKILKMYDMFFENIESKYVKYSKTKPMIFLTHNVPYNTKLDMVNNKKSWAHKQHYGSKVARDICLKYKPLVCIGGHMHEHFGKCKLGKTTVINAGFGSYVNVLLEIKNNKIKQLKFYRGKKEKHKH